MRRRNPPSREREAERRRDLDPEDRSKAIAAVAALARVEGPSAYTRLLNDRLVWNDLAPELQNQVISIVGESLGRPYRFVDTRIYECGGQRHRIGAFRHEKTGIVLHLLPGGQYMMGSPESDDEADDDERPQHPVVIDPFLCGRFPVTQFNWLERDQKKVFEQSWNEPMNYETWDGCKAWLSRVGGELRLLLEQEWEYACRSGSATRRFWGDEMNSFYVWYRNNSDGRTHEVTDHWDAEAWNSFGLVDMLGNVCEWCESYCNGASEYRVARGGDWDSSARAIRCSSNLCVPIDDFSPFIGFRVARSLS